MNIHIFQYIDVWFHKEKLKRMIRKFLMHTDNTIYGFKKCVDNATNNEEYEKSIKNVARLQQLNVKKSLVK